MVSQLWCSSSARHILNSLGFTATRDIEGFWTPKSHRKSAGLWEFSPNFVSDPHKNHEKRLPIDDLHSWSFLVISRHLPFGSPKKGQRIKESRDKILSHPRMNRPHKFVPRHLNHAWSRLCCPAQHDLSLSTHESVDHWDKHLELVKTNSSELVSHDYHDLIISNLSLPWLSYIIMIFDSIVRFNWHKDMYKVKDPSRGQSDPLVTHQGGNSQQVERIPKGFLSLGLYNCYCLAINSGSWEKIGSLSETSSINGHAWCTFQCQIWLWEGKLSKHRRTNMKGGYSNHYHVPCPPPDQRFSPNHRVFFRSP